MHYGPEFCAVTECGKALPPPYRRPFWLRGSDLCARHATYKKRIEAGSREARLYLQEWTNRERGAVAEMIEPEFVYLKDSPLGRTRKYRASSLTGAPAGPPLRYKVIR